MAAHREAAAASSGTQYWAKHLESSPVPADLELQMIQAAYARFGPTVDRAQLEQFRAEFYQAIHARPGSHVGNPAMSQRPATTRPPPVKRARLVKDGTFTMIVYGADETLKWAKRVGQFTSTVRHVLGDRKLNFHWRGSVLDSVVGAFLTQNVSDALSSKAFMMLTATFPARPSPPAQAQQAQCGESAATAIQPADEVSAIAADQPAGPEPVEAADMDAGSHAANVGRMLSAPSSHCNEHDAVHAVSRGLVSLEWLRDPAVSADQAREYLMNIAGLGRKSVACILLLALRKKDFPVDTNVGRICARLGWLPIDSEAALEDLDEYAPEPEVHKYLHSRLMGFDVDTLYELHYQMITLGKVFCSKRSPNCSACPLQSMCEYAQSGGARLRLSPGSKPQGANQPHQGTQPAKDGPGDGGVEGSTATIAAQPVADLEDLGTDQRSTVDEEEVVRVVEAGRHLQDVWDAADLVQDAMDAQAGAARLCIAALAVLALVPPASRPLPTDPGLQDSSAALPLRGVPAIPAAAVRRRFRELSVLVHPDKCTHASAEKAFAILRQAQTIVLEHISPASPPTDASANEMPLSEGGASLHMPGKQSRGLHLVKEAVELPLHLLPPGLQRLYGHCPDAYACLGLILDDAPDPPLAPSTPAKADIASLAAMPQEPSSSDAAATGETAGLVNDKQLGGSSPDVSGNASGRAEPQQATSNNAGDSQQGDTVGMLLLVPCRLALAGRFPLNGTYFQVNEFFLDHTSLANPLQVYAGLLADGLRKRHIYFGQSISSICRGMTQHEVAALFKDGRICVRAYQPASGAPLGKNSPSGLGGA
ncbi:hypothetical protein WJX72_009565 [[Myrmecia] bisecta]|uniref:HhH-GPD domain-containing protein n=1 Tax=[Myrmecia] bisecta TaxID=41462 RepID=A0AAW1Q889_9CHLO